MLKINISSAKKIVVGLIAGVLLFGAGYSFGALGFQIDLKHLPHVTVSRQVPVDKNLDFSLFWQVWDKLNATYFDKSKISESNMIYGAIKGMVASVGDPYTAFFTPAENKSLTQDLKGNFEGAGVEIGFDQNKLVVIAPLSGGPADKAGVKAGDGIVEIKDSVSGTDKTTEGMSLADAVALIRGPKGTHVTLVLKREGQNENITKDIVRDTIHVATVNLFKKGEKNDIALVKITKFGDDTLDGWKNILPQLQSSDVRGIIIDLRNNPGGYFEYAIDIANEFLPSGANVVTEDDGKGRTNDHNAPANGSLMNVPVVVLINKGSASASEILAGALHDNNRGTLFGDTSFGKGTIQEPDNFDNGAGIHITISKWLTPKGDWVNGKGITPDKPVKESDDIKKDSVLDAAVTYLEGK